MPHPNPKSKPAESWKKHHPRPSIHNQSSHDPKLQKQPHSFPDSTRPDHSTPEIPVDESRNATIAHKKSFERKRSASMITRMQFREEKAEHQATMMPICACAIGNCGARRST
ncbi:hypothetical protein M758_6G182000 [Ceratodon purpureus]|uniref:Uncharacterized protein n=1 Tax=Ceratodon purpureus TaxID=3225 RepID=A0A8T0HJ42_CERPU|nr:hypothetical protein KC19_6G189400 [Ceratodon purpureus]KAG0614501.1 hypothetical protein M758_6G182000 [Ceratodon purpureus]